MKAVFVRFLDVLRDGFSLFWIAPAIAGLVVIPEMIQHIAEINLGMFESREAFRALADDPRRMVWGVIKIAGLLLAILASARFWGARARGQKWWDVRSIAWRHLLIALGLLILTAVPGVALPSIMDPQIADIISLAIAVATLPLFVLLIGGLIGDRSASLAKSFKSGWVSALSMIIYAAACWVPLQYLHGQTHQWALGQSDPVVWALMIFDSLVVGALAVLAGTAFHHGYDLRNRNHA